MTEFTAIPLTATQRRDLKARAHPIEPVVIIGDAGMTPAVLREIDVHLKSHELIKIRVTGGDRDARAAMIDTVCGELNASLVQHIGKTLIVFRPKPPEHGKPKAALRAIVMPSKRKHAARNSPRRTKRSYQGSK